MELVPAGVLSFEVTYDSPSLFVGMLVYDVTASPLLVQGPTPMTHVVNNTYLAKFTASDGRSYLIVKAVYTDNTYTVIDSNYSQGSESIIAESIQGGSAGGCSIVGYVNMSQDIVGYVMSDDTIAGFVNC